MNNYYAFASVELLLTMSEERQKNFYEGLAGLLGKEREKAKQPEPPKNPYEQNETMRMIGQQNIERYIDNEETGQCLKDIIQARGHEVRNVFGVVFDAFLYGCIIGKRAERTRKKATAKPSTVKQ